MRQDEFDRLDIVGKQLLNRSGSDIKDLAEGLLLHPVFQVEPDIFKRPERGAMRKLQAIGIRRRIQDFTAQNRQDQRN